MRIAVFILIISTLSAQGQAILDASSLNAIVNSNGKMFGAEGVKYPKSENKFSFGETMLWISGYHGADSFISANILNNNTSDFQAGPISDDGLSGSQDSKWNTVYAVSSHASFIHKNNFNKENYTTPNSILNWQANGESGFTNILAPFVDWNSNDIYEPTQGDYPYIYGDQMAYTVFNDRGVHGLTGGDGMGIQVENLVSVYGDNGNDLYSNLVINRILLSNKSAKDYTNFKLSILSDFVLGDDEDNFIGTHVKDNFVYCYNSSPMDNVYGNKIPALVVFPLDINDSMLSALYLTKTANAFSGMPSTKNEFFNFSKGLWKNGKFIAYGGSGIDGVIPCNFVYSGTTDEKVSGDDWNENDVGNTGGERTILMNLGLNELESNKRKEVSICYAILDEFTGDLEELRSFVQSIRNANSEGLYTGLREIKTKSTFYPNLTNAGQKVTLDFNVNGHEVVNLYDVKGNLVQEIRNLRNNFFILNSGLIKGVYFLKIQRDVDITYGKLIVQ